MPAERKIQVEIEGKKHEVPVPEGFVHTDDLKETHVPKEHFQTELQNRVANITKGLRKPEDLLKDDDFFKTFVDTRRPDLVKVLDIKVDPKLDVTKIQGEAIEQFKRTEFEPLAKKLEEGTREIGLLRERDFDAQVAEAAADLRVVPGLRDLVKVHVRNFFTWDPERRQWFQKKEDGTEGFELSADPKKGGHPYATVREFMIRLARDPERKSWFESAQQPGADYRGQPGGGGAKQTTLDQYEKMSQADKTKFAQDFPAEFRALMEQKRKAGEDKLFARR